MSRLNAIRAVVFRLSFWGMFLTASLARAQTSQPTGREGFTGKQLFEHQWQIVERSQQAGAEPVSADELLEQAKQKRRRASAFAREPTENDRLALGDGLGPLHNARSCAECHRKGGASGVEHNVTHLTIDPRSEVLNLPKSGAAILRSLFPASLEVDGTLLFDVLVHDRSTRAGYAEIRSNLATHVPGGIDDAWFLPEKRTTEMIARQPVIAGRYEVVDFYLSQLSSPPLFGLGRIEKIPHAALVEIAAGQSERSQTMVSGLFSRARVPEKSPDTFTEKES